MAIILNIKSKEDFFELNVSKVKVIVGRSKQADCRIKDERISGKHCSIQLDDNGQISVKDLDSSNGTFLGSSQIENTNLMIGDKLRIGNTFITIDTKALTPKEKKQLEKDEDATQIRYLDLNGPEDATKHAIKIRNNAANEKKKKKKKSSAQNSIYKEKQMPGLSKKHPTDFELEKKAPAKGKIFQLIEQIEEKKTSIMTKIYSIFKKED